MSFQIIHFLLLKIQNKIISVWMIAESIPAKPPPKRVSPSRFLSKNFTCALAEAEATLANGSGFTQKRNFQSDYNLGYPTTKYNS